jgi:2-polyprenyl-3-methyl-5-hydroxy-6-metoxy-1,4-benzoquinol methylase
MQHVFVDGYFTPEALTILFSSTHSNQTPGNDVEAARYISARMVRAVNNVLSTSSRRWLDIGFGNGALMTTAEEFGFDVVGLNLRESSVELMRTFGLEAHAVKFEDYQPAERFDVISMADVLEHMPFPKGALRQAFDLLNNDDGVLFLSMPNSDAFVWRFLDQGAANPYWGEIEHYHNLGRRRRYDLLDQFGFEPVHYGVSERYRACMEVASRKWPPR